MRVRTLVVTLMLLLGVLVAGCGDDGSTSTADTSTSAPIGGFTVAPNDWWGGEIVGKTYQTATCDDVQHLTFRHVSTPIIPKLNVPYGLMRGPSISYVLLRFRSDPSSSSGYTVDFTNFPFCFDSITPTIVP